MDKGKNSDFTSKLEDKYNSLAQDKLIASTRNNKKKLPFPEIPLFAKRIVDNIIVRIKPSTQVDILAYIDWCDLNQVIATNKVLWHSYATLKIRIIQEHKVVKCRCPNKQLMFAANYKLQDGKHTAAHYIYMSLVQWGMQPNYPVTLTKAEFEGKELKERPLYGKDICNYLGLHLKPAQIDGNAYVVLVQDKRGCKANS
jgi:hypothetical protein